jgi:hypothetical protein
VFRQWGLQGVAILPYGSDNQTSVQFAAGDPGEVEVSLFQHGATMTKPTEAPVNKPAEQPAITPPAGKTGAEFLTAFGDAGGRWFAEGKTFEESLQLFTAGLQQQLVAKDKLLGERDTELKTLKEQFAAVSGGQPVSANTPPAGGTAPAAAKSPLEQFGASLKFTAGAPQ